MDLSGRASLQCHVAAKGKCPELPQGAGYRSENQHSLCDTICRFWTYCLCVTSAPPPNVSSFCTNAFQEGISVFTLKTFTVDSTNSWICVCVLHACAHTHTHTRARLLIHAQVSETSSARYLCLSLKAITSLPLLAETTRVAWALPFSLTNLSAWRAKHRERGTAKERQREREREKGNIPKRFHLLGKFNFGFCQKTHITNSTRKVNTTSTNWGVLLKNNRIQVS